VTEAREHAGNILRNRGTLYRELFRFMEIRGRSTVVPGCPCASDSAPGPDATHGRPTGNAIRNQKSWCFGVSLLGGRSTDVTLVANSSPAKSDPTDQLQLSN
jgi:hypothetical protein